MSGPSILPESPTKTTMLATSMGPPVSHFQSRLGPVNALSVLPQDNVASLSLMTSKRPKLSLKTSDIAPTYVGSTSGRNATHTDKPSLTPTTLNTFTNTFDLTYRPSPSSTLPSPGASLARKPSAHQSLPYTLNLPYGVYSILKNSPLPRDIRRPSLASTSASPRIANRRVFFPAPKKVTFKPVLEEEIVNQQYVMRHADLSTSEEDVTSSDSEEHSERSCEETEDEAEDRGIQVDEISSRGRRKRKSMTASDRSEPGEERGRDERSRSTSERRTKRKKRRWEWTVPSEKKQVETSRSESDGEKDEVEAPVEAPVDGDEK